MKHISMIAETIKPIKQVIAMISLFMMLLVPAGLVAQEDSTAAEEAPEEPALISPSIDFTVVQKGDNTVDLKAILKAKVKGSQYRLYKMKIVFTALSDSAEKEIGNVITDGNGIAFLNVKTDQLITDAEGKLHFKASFAGNKSAESAEEELAVKRGKLIITPVKEDSLLSVQVKFVDMSSGTETAVPETDLGLFVKRQFKPLKVGEGKTDENGEVSVEIPQQLPGDARGNLTLLARIEDNEDYGAVEASVIQPWGTPVSDKIEELPRALWSPHPPLWMLVTFIILVGVVWGHYIVIVYELFRLRKEQPHTTDSQL
ncbi:MAG: hypothetical protein JNK14_06500 [Chitinophagaceae bacterium]|nr:hypothetical protein [Chitinophagaceae bacterium]